MRNETDEFSFVLKPAQHGVGVFAVHAIAKGTKLRLFGEEGAAGDIVRKKSEVPKEFWDFCIDKGEELISPLDFGRMQIGWYMNHSKDPNAMHEGEHFYALKDIAAGEEVLIDYNTLGESEEAKANFYKS